MYLLWKDGGGRGALQVSEAGAPGVEINLRHRSQSLPSARLVLLHRINGRGGTREQVVPALIPPRSHPQLCPERTAGPTWSPLLLPSQVRNGAGVPSGGYRLEMRSEVAAVTSESEGRQATASPRGPGVGSQSR